MSYDFMRTGDFSSEAEAYRSEVAVYENQWRQKPLLRKIYRDFYKQMSIEISRDIDGEILEIGSGMGQVKEFIPDCISTDIFEGAGIDRIENAYDLSGQNHSASNILLLDVFHHLRYPFVALNEFHRVLRPGGKVILLEPLISPLSLPIYCLFHHEPVGLFSKIETATEQSETTAPFAAQAQPTRIFLNAKHIETLRKRWDMATEKKSYLRYFGSGGFRKHQLYPTRLYESLNFIDTVGSLIPSVFGTRLLVTLTKKADDL